MENRAFRISSAKNPSISIKVIPGHFATSNSHITHYLDMRGLKSNSRAARDSAEELAVPYLSSTPVDTIVCMEQTEVIGAYLAEELVNAGISVLNSSSEIHILAPMSNINGKLIFHSNAQDNIFNRNVLLLLASVSSGSTAHRAMECITYYGGRLVGISALFSKKPNSLKINSIFTSDDIPNFQSYRPTDCMLCKEGRKLDAIVNSEGYTII